MARARRFIAENATLILPMHCELDTLRRMRQARAPIGTTKRGIGPAYEDKVGRRAIHMADLKNLKTLPAKIDRAPVHQNALGRGLGQPEIFPSACSDRTQGPGGLMVSNRISSRVGRQSSWTLRACALALPP